MNYEFISKSKKLILKSMHLRDGRIAEIYGTLFDLAEDKVNKRNRLEEAFPVRRPPPEDLIFGLHTLSYNHVQKIIAFLLLKNHL